MNPKKVKRLRRSIATGCWDEFKDMFLFDGGLPCETWGSKYEDFEGPEVRRLTGDVLKVMHQTLKKWAQDVE